MKFSLFKYGTGILYGPSLTFTDILPDRGPSTGGTPFVVLGSAFDYVSYDDDFKGAVLDPGKWTDISVGGGSATVSSEILHLSSGATAGDIGGVVMAAGAFDHIQYETKVNIPPVTVYPPILVSLFTISLYADANNYSNLSVNLAADGSVTLNCIAYKSSIQVGDYSCSWTTGVSTFKILRWRSVVQFYANGSLVYECKQANILTSNFFFYVNNLADDYTIFDTKVDYIINRPYVVFGEQIVHDVVHVSELRLRGLTPPSIDYKDLEEAYAGTVHVHVVTNAAQTKPDAFEYYFLPGLILIDDKQFGYKVSDISDTTVRTPALVDRGL